MASSPEGEVTVLAEETVASGDGSNSAKSKSGASVLLKRDVKTRTKKIPFEKNYRKAITASPWFELVFTGGRKGPKPPKTCCC